MKSVIQALVRGLVVLAPLWLSACIDVTSVQQPASGQVNVPFNVQINATSTSACEVASSCTPYVSVSLPAGWTVESCTYAGGVSGTCSASAASTPGIAPTAPANAWQTFAGVIIMPAVELPVGTTATVTLRIRPTTLGAATLDYVLGADKNGLFTWGTASMAHPITIQAAAVTGVPTLTTYGYVLMALGLAAMALRQRRKSQGG
ncbi:MAG: hypothetical protein R3E52_10800 [Burkholderiaceae bacterium]